MPTAAMAVACAWVIDLAFGEPRNALHPVAWMGRVLRPIGLRVRALRPRAAFGAGAVAWCALVTFAIVLAWWLERQVAALGPWWAVPLLAVLLKPMFAWRMLRDEVAAVEEALAQGIQPARDRLARLVSRDVSAFGPAEVRETAIETLAENLNDSLIAPLFWFAVAGLPGAVAYRLANTMDAMWGYRGEWEWAGKWAARADDALSWLPARLTALLLAPMHWRRLRAEAVVTPSPNGGWPMGAMALRLGCRLGKPGVYVLNAAEPSPTHGDIARALQVAGAAAWGGVVLVGLVCLGRAMW